MEEQKAHSMNPRNVFTDPGLPRGAMQLFAVICGFDSGRGCWAGRDTLARMVNASVSSVEHWVSHLKRRGYLTVQRRKDLPAMLRVDPDSRRLSGLGGAFSRMEREKAEDRFLEEAPGAGLEDATDRLDPEPVPEALPEPAPEALLENVTEAGKSSTAFNKQQTETTTNSYQEDLYSVRPDEAPVDAVVVSKETENNVSVSHQQAPEPGSESFAVADAVPAVVEGKVESNVSVPTRGRCRINRGPLAISDILPSVLPQRTPTPQLEPVSVADAVPSVSLEQPSDPGSGSVPDTNPLHAVTTVLTGVGVDASTARDLARSFPASKCRAMAAYAQDSEADNPGGFIRQGLREGWAIPSQHHRSGTSEKRTERSSESSISAPATPQSPAPGRSRPAPNIERDQSRREEIWREVTGMLYWEVGSHGYWESIHPLCIARIGEDCVWLQAPDRKTAEDVRTGYGWLLGPTLSQALMRKVAVEFICPDAESRQGEGADRETGGVGDREEEPCTRT